MDNFKEVNESKRLVKLITINEILIALKNDYIGTFKDTDLDHLTDFEEGYFKGMDNAIDIINNMKGGV